MKKGIWRFEDKLKSIGIDFQLSLSEGNTELVQKEIDSKYILFKLEHLNPNQSFKDRSLAYWLSYYYSQGKSDFVISSSGNAATSAIAYCNLFDASLKVYVSENIPDYKFKKLVHTKGSSEKIKIIKSNKPKSDAFKYVRDSNAMNLRGSTDDNAIEGFKTLAFELCEQDKTIDALFVCCSSGTSLSGIYEGYKQVGTMPQLHIVQTTKINPIACEFDSNFQKTNNSIANAVSDKVAMRKNRVVSIINNTGGSGWVVSDTELVAAKSELVENRIDIEGYNAYVSYAGFKKALNSGWEFKNPVCIISGI
jgi:threonine synthase